ncbi:hypothetical protein HY384_00110 [Candidatus Daviesbacteria bacterium]|nr:hypothetical protein [Candidatus Daviesbacteria bacterium]
MIQTFESATYNRPPINSDTDVVYVYSGPGPYSYNLLEPGKTDLEDFQYHKYPWSRKMDRAKIRFAYALIGTIAAKRMEDQTGVKKASRNLTSQEYENFGPFLMYTSTNWQNAHIRHTFGVLKQAGLFKIPDSKLVMYEEFTNRLGERKPIIHTEDQTEGLQFPLRPDGSPPRRIAMISHPAHLMRVMHILGKYQDSIPESSILQIIPVHTPKAAVIEYARIELLGTIGTVFSRKRASLIPFTKYTLD